jgi:hypothetical protein
MGYLAHDPPSESEITDGEGGDEASTSGEDESSRQHDEEPEDQPHPDSPFFSTPPGMVHAGNNCSGGASVEKSRCDGSSSGRENRCLTVLHVGNMS